MKNIVRLATLLFLLAEGFQATGQINVITYNIRLNTPADGEHAWPNRKDDVVNLLKFHGADIFCLQEALVEQVQDVQHAFPGYSYAGVGRDDGIEKGEFSPVFFNTERFIQGRSGNFWLSENPEVPGLGWDAACIRICSWTELTDNSTGKKFFVYNTHFDHVGVEARKNAADLIISRIKEISGNVPTILCGDLNLPPESVPVRKLSAFLHDAYTISELPPHGPRGSWAGFTFDDEPGARIDYIFVSEGIKVKRYGILSDSRDRSFFSDHLPVLAELLF